MPDSQTKHCGVHGDCYVDSEGKPRCVYVKIIFITFAVDSKVSQDIVFSASFNNILAIS